MLDLQDISTKIVAVFRWMAGICLVALTIFGGIDVTLYALDRPIVGSGDVEKFLGAMAMAFALPQTQYLRGHVRVQVLIRALKGRGGHLLDVFSRIVSLALCVLISWQIWEFSSYLQGPPPEVTPVMGWPLHYLAKAVSISFAAVCPVLIAQGADSMAKAVRS